MTRLLVALAIIAAGLVPAKAAGIERQPPGRYSVVGRASWYGPWYDGLPMANGEPFDSEKLTIATHLPVELGRVVEIESACGRVKATVTDRMPRPDSDVVIDVSNAVADELFCSGYGFNSRGVGYGHETITMTVAVDWQAIDGDDAKYDVNDDGVIDAVDAQLVTARWGKQVATSLVYEGKIEPYMSELGSAGHDFWWKIDVPGQIPKINYASDFEWTDQYDKACPASFNGGFTLDQLYQEIRDSRPDVVIIGEEPNLAVDDCDNSMFCGQACCGQWGCYLKARPFAHFYHDVTEAVNAGWDDSGGPRGKIVGLYFAQDDLRPEAGCGNNGRSSLTAAYLDDFIDEWYALWPDKALPIDFVAYNHHPACSIMGEESSTGSAAKSVAYWMTKSDEIAARLPTADLWIETTWGRSDDGPCGAARRLVNARSWGGAHTLMWFSTVFEDWMYPTFRDSALYDELGELTVVGEAFRDGAVPAECWQ